jgi:hypothetical protein
MVGEVMVQLLSGPHAGTYMYEADNEKTALQLLEYFIQRRWNWRLCHTGDEDPAVMQGWLNADLLARVMRALLDGRGIRFAGRRWQCRAGDKEDGRRVLDQVTDELARASYFKVFSDEPDGDLVITYTRPRSHRTDTLTDTGQPDGQAPHDP